jgi:alkaline phosphatase
MKLNQPTLLEMTSKALERLNNNDKGYVLLVEGGRIDTAHHETRAKLALEEASEFHKTIDFVKKTTNEEETLIIVTSDHSTVLTVGGYMPRGFNILGPGDYSQIDKKWFFSLSYANGPGYFDHINEDGSRSSPQGKHYLDLNFRQPTTVPENEETHAGEDVAVFANGPQSHLFTGVFEQNYLAHAMAYATCLGPDEFEKHPKCDGSSIKYSFMLILITVFIALKLI